MLKLGKRTTGLVLCGSLLLGSCYGPFNLTRRLHHWNGSFDGKWAEEGVFLVCIILPVYGIATWADAIIFNSIEFWTGDNPIDPPGMAKVYRSGNTEVVAQRTDGATGSTVTLAIYENGQAKQEFFVSASEDRPTEIRDGTGRLLGSARTLDDGSVAVYDASGAVVQTFQ